MSPTAPPPTSSGSRTRTALIVLAAIAALGLAACLACGVGGWLWLERTAGEMRETGARVEGEAQTFAAAHTQAECVDESLRRNDLCAGDTDVMCRAQAGVFLRRCIDRAAPSPGLCDGTPRIDDIMGRAEWAVGHCRRVGRGADRSCPQLVGPIVEHCAARAPASDPTTGP